MTAVDSAVQPLRSNTTCSTPMAKGTAVTTSTAYHSRDGTRRANVTAMATAPAAHVVRHTTTRGSAPARPSAVASTTSAYAKPTPTCTNRAARGTVSASTPIDATTAAPGPDGEVRPSPPRQHRREHDRRVRAGDERHARGGRGIPQSRW